MVKCLLELSFSVVISLHLSDPEWFNGECTHNAG